MQRSRVDNEQGYNSQRIVLSTLAEGTAAGAVAGTVLEFSAVAVRPQPKFSVPATIL